MAIKSIDPNTLSIAERHRYLLTAVAPRPIAFASTTDKAGNVNLSPFSFFNVFSSNPPVMIFSPARSGRDGSMKDTYNNVKEVPQVTINIVNYPMVEQMSLSSTPYPPEVNEFVKAGFTEVASDLVAPPWVKEAPAAFECEVDQVIELGQEGAAGNLIISRVVRMHFNERYLDAEGQLDTKKLDLVGRLGNMWYCRANGEALFEVPKPTRPMGMGVDQLPEAIRNSAILRGNDLGKLGHLAELPDAAAVAAARALPEVQSILAEEEPREGLHRFARALLEDGQVPEACAVLMIEK
ncbi:MAG: flavin reductase family protein [Bacteroidota bacterium]